MEHKTFETYKLAVKAKYESEKTGRYAGYLLQPTPARIKKLCLLLADTAGRADSDIFGKFFGAGPEEDLTKKINRHDTSKLKPICTFLKGETELSLHTGVDLIAVLADFQPRPLGRFLSSSAPAQKAENDTAHDPAGPETQTYQVVVYPEEKEATATKAETRRRYLSGRVALVAGCLLASVVIFNIWDYINPRCMIWEGDHYEAVSCDKMADGSVDVVPLDRETLENLRKITATDTTSYFTEEGEPRVWYGKSASGEYEYFSYYGLHPVTKKTLKPITEYMIKKHILGKRE